MSSYKSGRWAQAAGFLGVTASLLFVAYELKQSRDIAVAEIYQQKTAMLMSMNSSYVDPSELLDAYVKLAKSPDALEIRDLWLLEGDLSVQFGYYENNHFQYQIGMISEEQMDTIRSMIASSFVENYVRDFWIVSSRRGSWRKSFVTEVDKILADHGPAELWGLSEQEDYVMQMRCIASGKCPAGSEL